MNAALQLARMHQQSQPEQTFLNSIGAVHVGLKNYEQAEQAFNQALSHWHKTSTNRCW